MMPALVDNRSGNGHSRWRVAGRAQVRSIHSCCRHRSASFPHKLFGPIVLAAMPNSSRGKPIAEIAAIQSSQPWRSRQIPIAPAAPLQRHPPRFRALALLGRRRPRQADGSSSRRPRNLHRNRHHLDDFDEEGPADWARAGGLFWSIRASHLKGQFKPARTVDRHELIS